MDKVMINYRYILCLLGAIATVCEAVKITSLKVPSVYILDNQENPEPLILDCVYEVSPSENGFVLKWLLNDHRIYQWIPSNHQPHSLSFMKNHINVNHTVSNEALHKYRALAITKPTLNMTGTYSCNVGSYQSEDKRSAHLQIIVPESDLQVKVVEDVDDNIKVECTAKDVFPEPKLSIYIGKDENQADFVIKSNRDDNGLYDVIIFGKVKKSEVIDPSSVDCILSIPGTNYTKRKEASHFANKSPSLTLHTAIIITTLAVTTSSILHYFI